jgi:hypothetical protein
MEFDRFSLSGSPIAPVTAMYIFHVTVLARADTAVCGPTLQLGGRAVQTLSVPQEDLSAPFGLSFEEAEQRIGLLPRAYIEPDGSFFWGSPAGEPNWQVDGNLFDRNGRLAFVDLRGSCPPEEFDQLLSALGWPATPLIFQLVQAAILLDEAEFRSWAGGTR